MPNKNNSLIERPPVIAVMGHIDHGKSTLLDFIRRANTTAREAGGITQHVAAYEVKHKDKEGRERTITFLDTPGHAAFEGIRIRGAHVADIAILVISAEEGVKPQTLEALKHIQEAETPYLVALNKIDSPKADVERTKGNMAEHEIYVEGYGGSTPWVAISAKTGEGIPDLLDTVLLLADLEELRGDPSIPAQGFVIESNRDTKKGMTATLVIKDGSLSKGMAVLSGCGADASMAPVRIMEDFSGKPISEARFSSPVRLVGFDSLPKAGDAFSAFPSKKDAERELERRASSAHEAKGAESAAKPAAESAERPTVPLVIKADVSGTLEAIEHEFAKLPQEKVSIKILSAGIGDITENDVKAAVGAADKAFILGFNARTDALARAAAEREGVSIESFDIIYKLIERVEALLTERTPKVQVEEVSGSAKILKTFSRVKDRQVVGGRVLDGLIAIGDEVRISRREALIGTGRLRELQQQKMKASEARKDTEFGAMIESKIEIAPGDRIEAFTLVTK